MTPSGDNDIPLRSNSNNEMEEEDYLQTNILHFNKTK